MGTRLAGVACLLFLLLLRAPVPGAWAARPDEDQAVAVLRAALDARRGRAPDEALVGLRQLRDPALRPLFASLASGAEPALRRHGVLGLAELESPARINTLMLSRTQDAAELAALLGEALALDLIGTEQIEGILSWPGLDPVVEIILRGRLLAEGRPADEKRLEALAGAGGPMTQILGALVLSAAGKPGRLPEAIDRLRAAEEPERGLVSGRLLEFIRRERTPGSGPLLGALAEMYADQPPLLADILRTWLRIDPAGAAPVWQRAWAASGELSNRLRLAMGALAAADRLPPAFFEAMREGVEDPLLLAMARAGGGAVRRVGGPGRTGPADRAALPPGGVVGLRRGGGLALAAG